MLAVRLDPVTEERLSRLAHETGRSKRYYVKQAIENHLEEREDYLLALAVLVELTVTAEMQLGETIEEIVAIIKAEFPEARAAVAGWFRSYFRIEGTPEHGRIAGRRLRHPHLRLHDFPGVCIHAAVPRCGFRGPL